MPKVERLIFLPGMNEITMAQLLITNEIDMAFSLTVPELQGSRRAEPEHDVALLRPKHHTVMKTGGQ